MNPWDVPPIQKRIVETCKILGKPVVIATQMLERYGMCYVMSCYVVLCFVMLCYVMLCYDCVHVHVDVDVDVDVDIFSHVCLSWMSHKYILT